MFHCCGQLPTMATPSPDIPARVHLMACWPLSLRGRSFRPSQLFKGGLGNVDICSLPLSGPRLWVLGEMLTSGVDPLMSSECLSLGDDPDPQWRQIGWFPERPGRMEVGCVLVSRLSFVIWCHLMSLLSWLCWSGRPSVDLLLQGCTHRWSPTVT